MSQKYGIGAKWVRGNWTGFCDGMEYKDTDCQSGDERYVWNYYSVGPPYMMHIEDWKLVSPKWIEYSPNALEWDPPPSILAEMYSFVLACAIYNLKHEYLLSMVSHPDSNKYMENTFDIEVEEISMAQFKLISYFALLPWVLVGRQSQCGHNSQWRVELSQRTRARGLFV